MFRHLSLLAIVAVTAGCGLIDEERGYYMKRDWNRLFDGSLGEQTEESLGWDQAFTSKGKEMRAEQRICLHGNGQNRIVTQNGVSDEVAYRRCALSPYAMDGGSRLGIRPDGQGAVVR